jgi:hypothetical protein
MPDDFCITFPDVRSYYKKEMKFINQQPAHHHDLAPSLIEENARSVTAQQDWENEWNSAGLASRLTPEVWFKPDRAP